MTHKNASPLSDGRCNTIQMTLATKSSQMKKYRLIRPSLLVLLDWSSPKSLQHMPSWLSSEPTVCHLDGRRDSSFAHTCACIGCLKRKLYRMVWGIRSSHRFPTHRLIKRSPDFPKSLAHLPYLEVLPKPEQLLTPLHFSDEELELFRGSHLHGATIDRRNVLRREWHGCLEHLMATSNDDVYQQRYTW